MEFKDLLTGAGALLAFILAFYALAARERKTPYITESVYSAVLLVLFILILGMIPKMYSAISNIISGSEKTRFILELTYEFLLIFAVVFTFYRIWRINNKHRYFRDDHLIRNIFIVRHLRNFKKQLFPKKPSYEHSSIGIPDSIINLIIEKKLFPKDQLINAKERNSSMKDMHLSLSATYNTKNWVEADVLSTKLAICFLEFDAYVQYTTCARHPIEFILQLKNAWEKREKPVNSKRWEEIRGDIVSVDAYTPHFGFTDTTHNEWTMRLEQTIGVKCLTSRSTFAGVHTSAAEAFNLIKVRHGKEPRHPTLVVYEGIHGLVDLESVEQYRIFLRHVLPSEKIWGGMFTFIIETAISEDEVNLLSSYSDVFIDKKDKPDGDDI